MNELSFDERNLLCIYRTPAAGRLDVLHTIQDMCMLPDVEDEIRQVGGTLVGKLKNMSDAEFSALEIYPDYDEDE